MEIRFALILTVCAAAGLGALRLAAPGRPDWLAAASAGAAFGLFAAVAGYEVVRRAAVRSAESGVRAFLAVMTAKVLAFAAFLLTIALTTALSPAALASGLVMVTLAGEIVVIASLRRAGGDGRGAAGGTGGGARAGPQDQGME